MDANYFLNYFTNDTSKEEATIISLEGRMYPVQVAYMDDPIPDYVQSAAQVAWNVNLQVRILIACLL
jgi:ATP-dependent RNA helicase DDX35